MLLFLIIVTGLSDDTRIEFMDLQIMDLPIDNRWDMGWKIIVCKLREGEQLQKLFRLVMKVGS